jgi:tetratricopeptide (TPR) repeat protein
LQKDPTDAQAYERRGFVFRSQKKYNEAIADYDKSLEIKPDPDVYAKRGYTYVTYLQNYEKGIADYQQTLRINPNDYDTQQRLQYAQSALAAKNAPPPAPTPAPTPQPGLFTPLNIGIGLVVLLVLIGVIFVLARRRGGGEDETESSGRIR